MCETVKDKVPPRELVLRGVTLLGGIIRRLPDDKDQTALALTAEHVTALAEVAGLVAEENELPEHWRYPSVKAFAGHDHVVSAKLTLPGLVCALDDGTLVDPKLHLKAGREADVSLLVFHYQHREHVGVSVAVQGMLVRGVPTALKGLLP